MPREATWKGAAAYTRTRLTRFRFIAGEVGFVPDTAEELLAESHRHLLLFRPSAARFDQSASRGTSMRPVAPVLGEATTVDALDEAGRLVAAKALLTFKPPAG